MARAFHVTARGPIAAAVIVLLGLGLRHLLVDPLRPEEAASIVRAALEREVSARYQPRLKSADGSYDREVAQEFAEAIRAVTREYYASVRVKNTWLPPIKVRQPTYAVEVTRESASEPEYYRVRGPFARRASRLWWTVPIL